MYLKMDELLLLENMVYLPGTGPFPRILSEHGKTVRECLDGIDMSKIDDEYNYASFMLGNDWKNLIMAIRRNDKLMNIRIEESNMDRAYGGGGGVSAVFLEDEEHEAIVAFRGTASNEWEDDFLGANQIDSLQQINALEWYRAVYQKMHLEDWNVTVLGHSKGGNKAKYVAILNDTPMRCVSFDGQGFSDKFVEHYRDRILLRQDVIENHNVDFDYVNILMNDIGKKTYYIGYDYGRFGFAEAHSPVTFFDFGENGEYAIHVNPNGQRPEMQIMDQFFNSMIRSAVNDKEKSETNKLVGILVQKAFAIGSEHTVTDYLGILCDMVADPTYSDNTAYLLAYCIMYSKEKPEFLEAVRGITESFELGDMLKIIDMVDDLLRSKKINRIINFSNFLVQHASSVLVAQVQTILKKRYDLDLPPDKVRGVLQILSMTKEMMNTLELNMDGSDLAVEDLAEETVIDPELAEEINIVVLAGGLSNERNLSLRTGYTVSEILKGQGHNVILLDSFMGYGETEENIKDAFVDPDKYSLELSDIPDDIPDLWAVRKRRTDQSPAYFGPNVIQICRQADMVFIALHGSNGENGKVQSMLDLIGISYTGCDYFSSALSSNKSVAKQLMAAAGVPVPLGYVVFRGKKLVMPEACGLNYPVIVKPNNGGIGIGISVANDVNAYQKAVREAFKWESDILVEEYVAGREFAVGTLHGKALPVLEVLPLETVDEESGMTLEGKRKPKCPADIPNELAEKLKEAAETVTEVLGVMAYAKMDFIVRDDGSFVCLECDSLPQLYSDAHFVLEAKTAGMEFEDLCGVILGTTVVKN
ncbi:MAG: ATP-grasp domain-containing protein [Lachnospiraceae bacterium]|nr:ATP-grasp domain-containing protein [Lachnospiraceae bacterium]